MHKLTQRAPASVSSVITQARCAAEDEAESPWLIIPDTSQSELVVRGAVWIVFVLWSFWLIGCDIRDGEISHSFIHTILLVIHEAGHMFFLPFGMFLHILGGSFFQVALPIAIGVAFLVRNRDPFGAGLCFWWGSVSIMDVAPYIYDALEPQLTLISGRTGAEDEGHDWINLLSMMGQLSHAHGIARAVWLLGVTGCLASLVWIAVALWCSAQRQRALTAQKNQTTLTGKRKEGM